MNLSQLLFGDTRSTTATAVVPNEQDSVIMLPAKVTTHYGENFDSLKYD